MAQETMHPENVEELKIMVPPYDILHKVEAEGQKKTIFEQYTLQVLETDIQEKSFGCKISNTHMRLGSTIHINSFYEAELLFSNRLFISRFAYLLVKGIVGNAEFKVSDCITLYSYALYSELLIYETMSILEKLYPNKEFDYAILEREADHRAFSHIDRIRYSMHFSSENERLEHFQNRKVICIVPINSTLKTHEKLIDLFHRDNPCFKLENIIMNYAVVLVGSKGNNTYWVIDKEKSTFSDVKLKIKPFPQYFVAVEVEYQEALGCKLCFPEKHPLEEIPLIEVNASSTIPDQAFGLYRDTARKTKIDYNRICKEEENLLVLKNSLIYSHVKRGENHFSMYFRTERIFVENKNDIQEWVTGLAKRMNVNEREYHILVCPSHFSNAGFLECINKIIFHDAALVVRVDIDKEYRCNMETKFSFVGEFLKILSQRDNKKSIVRVYYIDDSIVTGRTFQRAKSLISSVMGVYAQQYPSIDIYIFDKIFVLLDRNSAKTRMQYVECVKKGEVLIEKLNDNFFAYRSLRISSMRNHGDSCVICQLERQDRILHQASATQFMAEHWKEEQGQFSIRYLEDNREKDRRRIEKIRHSSPKKDLSDRAFRRMVCMHIAAVALDEERHGNRKKDALVCILELLLTDYKGRKAESEQEAFEYFLSYLKVMSRPFLAFSKAIREAIFDCLLMLSEYLLGDVDGKEIYDSIIDSKSYLLEVKALFSNVKKDILNDINDKKMKKDLLLVLMKQSMELRSNYFIRMENIRRLSYFVEQFDDSMKQDIYERYLWMVKKLIGVNSDTSKSAWLNKMLCQAAENKDFLGLPKDVYTMMILENTRGYYEGINRLSESNNLTKDMLETEIEKFQYRDFKSVLEDYRWITETGLTDSGLDSLFASVELLRLAKKFMESDSKQIVSENIREQCLKIAELIHRILGAQSVKLILELPLECDLWEDDVKLRFNRLLEENEKSQLQLEPEEKKEYLVIADSESKTSAARLPMEEAYILKEFRKTDAGKLKGFLIKSEKNCLIWEIGQKKFRPIIFYVKFEHLDDLRDLQLIRNIMMMSYYFNEHIFNRKTNNYLYELMLAEKERLVYNINKIESHTTSDVKNRQYEDTQSELAEKECYYKSYVLTLLADLQVSDIYRPSLHRHFYCRRLKIGSLGWDGTTVQLHGRSSFYVAGTSIYDYIKLIVCTETTVMEDEEILEESDKLIGYKLANGVRIPFLMIFALMMNAAVEGRAKEERGEGGENLAEICVYLTKTTEGNLRISNKCGSDTREIGQIQSEMDYPPGREQGISLWSMSRYIKSIISTLIETSLNRLTNALQYMESEQKEDALEKQKKMIETLLSDKYQIKVNRKEVGRQKYFYMDIPILSGKYIEYKEFFML